MPIGTVGCPHFTAFRHAADAPLTKTIGLIGKLNDIRRKSSKLDIVGDVNLTPHRRFYHTRPGGPFCPKHRFCFRLIVKILRVNVESPQEAL